MDDWWLVRDQQGHVGWVLAHMVDLDIPLDVAQYAEGQRIQAAFVLNTVQDDEKGSIPQYLVLLNENRDGIPYDFNQVRVFTWNLKRHRYETGYREHYIIGYFPVKVSNENFAKEGTMPVFTIRKQNADGSISERKYRLIGNIVRQVLAPGEQPQAAHSPDEPKRMTAQAKMPRQRQPNPPQALIPNCLLNYLQLLRRAIHPRRAKRESYSFKNGGYAAMAEKIKKLDLQRDYKKYLYFIDGKAMSATNRRAGKGNRRSWLNMRSTATTSISTSSTKKEISRAHLADQKKKAA